MPLTQDWPDWEGLPPADKLHPRVLAHLGDAVYELIVREWALRVVGQQLSHQIHRWTTARVKAEAQAAVLESLLLTLTEAELALVKQARNLPVPTHRRNNQALYRQATALEALVGWWYLQDADQLKTRLSSALQTLPQ